MAQTKQTPNPKEPERGEELKPREHSPNNIPGMGSASGGAVERSNDGVGTTAYPAGSAGARTGMTNPNADGKKRPL